LLLFLSTPFPSFLMASFSVKSLSHPWCCPASLTP
jgi:hypothetical protein